VVAAVLFTCAQNNWMVPTLPSSAAVSMLLQGQAEAEKVWPSTTSAAASRGPRACDACCWRSFVTCGSC
jgi:hypothetical protein